MMIPVLLDDLISFAVALAICFVFSLLGALVGGLFKGGPWPWFFARPVLYGTAASVTLFILIGLGALVNAGDSAVGGGFTSVWFTTSRMNQGALHLGWIRILTLFLACILAMVAFLVAAVSAFSHRENSSLPAGCLREQFLQWTLRQWLVLFLVASLVLGAWGSARQKSVAFANAKRAAMAKWPPLGFDPVVTSDGQIYSLKRRPGAVRPLGANTVREIADLPRLRNLDLSRSSLPEDCFAILKDAPLLHILDLSGSDVTDEMLQQVALLKVGLLYLDDTGITDTGLLQLKALMPRPLPRDRRAPSVTLHVHNTRVTAEGIAELTALGKAGGGNWFIVNRPRYSPR